MRPRRRTISTSRIKARRRRARIIKLTLLGLALLVFGGSLAYVLRMDQFVVHAIEVNGAKNVSSDSVKQVIEEELDGSVLVIIPKSNSLFVSTAKIEEKVIEHMPALGEVTIKRDGMNRLVVDVKERVPVARICNGSNCHLVDVEGRVLGEDLGGNEALTMYTSMNDPEPGSFIVPEGKFKAVEDVIDGIRRTGLTVDHVYLQDTYKIEIYVREGTVLYASLESIDTVLSNLEALFNEGVLEKGNLGSVEYVDIRFGNKVFYKPRTP